MDSDNQKWRLKKIKSVRVSPELLEMLERELDARQLSFSQYVRHALALQMKYGNGPTHPTGIPPWLTS
jgi:hypothetical protein